jgi:hypothetical protein
MQVVLKRVWLTINPKALKRIPDPVPPLPLLPEAFLKRKNCEDDDSEPPRSQSRDKEAKKTTTSESEPAAK